MALIRDAVFKRPLNLVELIKLERSKVNLKALKRVTIKFDPFSEKIADFRNFTYWLHDYDIIKTNPKCIIKTEILTDRAEPHVTFDLIDGKQIIFKCTNLKCLEIFKLMNEHITPLAPVEEEPKVSKISKIVKKKK